MALFLSGPPVTVEQQKKNDRHHFGVVLAVLAVLVVYFYLFTHVYEKFSVPAPQAVAEKFDFTSDQVFDSDGNVDSEIYVIKTKKFNNDDERFVLFAIIAAAFLCSYFFSVKAKRPSLVLWFLVGFLILYGWRATSGLILGHLIVYLTFHPDQKKQNQYLSPLVGLLVFLSFFSWGTSSWMKNFGLAVGLGAGGYVVYHFVWLKILQFSKVARVLRFLVIQGPFLFSVIAACLEGAGFSEWSIPLGLLFYFLQWERLMIYHVDFKNGQVPPNHSFVSYLSVFFSPAVIPNWTSNPYIGQGYTYMASRFLCRDKNKIVLSGLKLWGFALLYLIIGDSIVESIIDFFRKQFHVTLYPYVNRMIRYYVHGHPMSTPTVLFTCLLDQVRFFLHIGAIVHFKVGAWRIFGFYMDPQYNKPWVATNLSTFWTRYAFHFREFLSRAFYYPVFLRYKTGKVESIFFPTFPGKFS